MAQVDRDDSYEVRVAKRFALAYAAALLAISYGVVRWNPRLVFRCVRRIYRRAQQQRVGLSLSPATQPKSPPFCWQFVSATTALNPKTAFRQCRYTPLTSASSRVRVIQHGGSCSALGMCVGTLRLRWRSAGWSRRKSDAESGLSSCN